MENILEYYNSENFPILWWCLWGDPKKTWSGGRVSGGLPEYFFLLKKAPSLTFSEANGAELTRRNGTDSGRPFVRPSVRPSSSSSMRGHGGRKRQTARGRQTDGPRSSRVWPTNHARPQTPPIAPARPRKLRTNYPPTRFPLSAPLCGPTLLPRPPRPAGPTTPRVSTLNRPKASLPCHRPDNKQTNKRTGTSVCPIPLAPSSQRWRQAPRDLLAPARARVSEWVSVRERERGREREHAHTHILASTYTHLT